jgi:hypothetical protein
MNHRVKQLEEEMEEIRTACEKNDGGLQNVRQQVDKLSEKVENISRQAAGAAAIDETSVYEELREREQRKTNVVIYGMKEAPARYTGMERWDWDKDSCGNLFRALKIDMPETSIKFLRRVGEAGEQPRPLVVGFYEEKDKKRLLRGDTRNTAFSDVEVCPDLTKRQRQEEAEMKKEAVKRNQQMGDEDRAKNLAWQVVGPRGERRLEKKYVNWELERGRQTRRDPREGQRGRGSSRPAGWTGRQSTSVLTGANNTAIGSGAATATAEVDGTEEGSGEDEEVEMESETETGGGEATQAARARGRPPLSKQLSQKGRPRLDSKRKDREMEREEEEGILPRAKH